MSDNQDLINDAYEAIDAITISPPTRMIELAELAELKEQIAGLHMKLSDLDRSIDGLVVMSCASEPTNSWSTSFLKVNWTAIRKQTRTV